MLNSQPARGPSTGLSQKRDLLFVGFFLALWIVPWLILFLAAKVSGGNPTASPLDFINISQQAAQHDRDHGWVLWHLVSAYGQINVFFFYLALTTISAIVIGGIYIVKTGNTSNFSQFSRFFTPQKLSSTSRWARHGDLRSLRVRGPRLGCFTIGRRGTSLLATEKETSMLIIGPTRSGKTTGLVIPNLFEWDGPAIVTSTKSELVEITAAYRQTVGPVYIYDPTGEISDRYQTVTWSPINGAQDIDYAWKVASWLCAGLQQGGSGKSDNDWQHWAASGKALIAPLLHVAAVSGAHDITDVHGWIQKFDLETPKSILQDMLDSGSHPSPPAAEKAIQWIESIDQRPEKERGTVFSTVMRIFDPFNESAVANSAKTSRFNAEEFLRRKGTLYLCTPSESPERVASLFVGILMTAVTRAYVKANGMPRGRLDPELGLFLDELANVVPIENLPEMASQGAGRGVILMSIVQDLSQLKTRYGADKAKSILNNHGATMILPGLKDPETCDELAKTIGRSDYTDMSISHQGDGKSQRQYSVKQDQMATPDALRQLHEGTAILVYKRNPPTIVRLRPWYRDRRFVELSQRRFFRNAEYVSPRTAA